MPIEAIVEQYIECWTETGRLLRKPVLLIPFIVLAIRKTVALLLVHYFWHPAVSGFMVPALKSLVGEEFIHFPTHIFEFPDVYHVIDMTLTLVVGFLLFGWAVFMIADAIEGTRYRLINYAGQVSVCIPSILLIGIIFVACGSGIPFLLGELSELTNRVKLQWMIALIAFVIGFGGKVLLVYSLVFLRYVRGRAFPALSRSINFSKSRLAVTAMVVATVLIIQKPFEYVASRTEILVRSSHSDWVMGCLLLGIVVETFALFYLFVATTLIAVGKNRWR